jgi:hypothetical protein
MVLAALHHQVERELVLLAARADGEATVTSQQYETNLKKWHDKSPRCRRLDLCKALNLRSFVEWDKSMETLRLLANCLKHDAHKKPSKKLLEHLNLPNVLNRPNIDQLVDAYLPLPESFFLKEGLAKSVNLPEDADYCAITDAFADLCNQFLDDVRGKTNAARITGIRISFAG